MSHSDLEPAHDVLVTALVEEGPNLQRISTASCGQDKQVSGFCAGASLGAVGSTNLSVTDCDKVVNIPTALVSKLAHANTKWNLVNNIWLLLFTVVTPAALALLWFALIPVHADPLDCKLEPGPVGAGCKSGVIRRCGDGGFGAKAIWVFLINPGTYVFFQFNLVNIFLGCLDEQKPWRPFWTYALTLLVGYLGQVGTVGLIVIFHHTFEGLGLLAISVSVVVTLAGLRFTPHHWFDSDKEHYFKMYNSFVKIMIVFLLLWMVLLSYVVAYANIKSGLGQGFITMGLSFTTFIFKKVYLAVTDVYPIEIAMVIAGLWLENLVDLFIVLAYPNVEQFSIAYMIIWLTRIAENIGYLVFQLDIWFRFRIWIKEIFKTNQGRAIEEDIDPDDRGHSNIHPGYRRRQFRFLLWKLVSQLSSIVVFLVVVPALRSGRNKSFFPYSNDSTTLIYDDVEIEEASHCFTQQEFQASMGFVAATFITFVVSLGVIFWFMNKYNRNIINDLKDRYKYLIVSPSYFGFVLSVLVSNVLLAFSAVQYYNRLYYI